MSLWFLKHHRNELISLEDEIKSLGQPLEDFASQGLDLMQK